MTKAVLIAPNGKQQLSLEKQFVDCAVEAEVGHIVKMSSMEAEEDAAAIIPRNHSHSEQYIKASGIGWTMIKPNFFMQNLLGSAGTIRDQGKLFLPLGEGKTAMSDTRDIGAVVAAVLTGEGHEGRNYRLTGPEVLSFYDVAERYSEVLGKKVEYVDMPPAAYKEVLGQFITNEWHLNAVCDLFAEIAEGGLDSTTDTVRELLGREPTSLKQFIRDHIQAYGG